MIGTFLTHGVNDDSVNVLNAVLQGLATGIDLTSSFISLDDFDFPTGTLVYVIFFEVLMKQQKSIYPYFSVLIGFLFMFGLQQAGELKKITKF